VAGAVAAFVVVVALVARSQASGPSVKPVGGQSTAGTRTGPSALVGSSADIAARCPWLADAIDRGRSPTALAELVLGRMTLDEKLGEIALYSSGDYENVNSGVPRLCIPSLAVQDGPQGLAYGDTNVTQLPAPLGIAATFDTSIARAYGEVEGSEASGQGLDAVQGPTLNIDRVPESGRSYEGYGEDPVLVSAMGVADIEGIQSTGTMAMAKHFAVYNQETDRGVLDDVVSQRALEELYLPPFKAAVTQAHVSTVMCAYPRLNGTFQCQDPQLLDLLSQWGFTGIVRSDLGSVHDPVAALSAGTNLIKPENPRRLAILVHEKRLPMSVVDSTVARVLSVMFAHHLVGRDDTGSPGTPVDSPAHTAFALTAAERSAVLLKDDGPVLPLSTARDTSIAVIGADAESAPETTGFGSSRVRAPFTSIPLTALRRRVGTGAKVTYSDGGSTTRDLPAVPADLLTPASGPGHGLTMTITRTDIGSGSARSVLPGRRAQHRRCHHPPPLVLRAPAQLDSVDRRRPRQRHDFPRPPEADPGRGSLRHPNPRGVAGRMVERERHLDRDAHPSSRRPVHALPAGIGRFHPHTGRGARCVRSLEPRTRTLVPDRRAHRWPSLSSAHDVEALRQSHAGRRVVGHSRHEDLGLAVRERPDRLGGGGRPQGQCGRGVCR
jgi:beta-glucosidase-like glycosyl hydrolase